MSRTNKNFTSKQRELLNQIWSIFLSKGYQNTTLSLILKELNISKGVFYHYFESKEQCAEAAVEIYSEMLVEKTIIRCQENGFNNQGPIKKLKMLIEQCKILFAENMETLQGINSAANRAFHQMLMVALTKKFSILYSDVIEEGIQQGIFNTSYPLEFSEMFLTLSNFYFDEDFFGWRPDELPNKVNAFFELLSKGLDIDIPLNEMF